MKLSKSLGAAAFALAALSAQAQSTNLILNGSFESNSGSNPTSWLTGTGAVDQHTNVTPLQDGKRYIDLDTGTKNKGYTNNSISQSFTGSGLVTLSFWYAPNSSSTGTTNQVNFALDSFLTGSVLGGSSNSTGWQNYTAQVDLGAFGTKTLSFTAAGASDGIGGYIDNVSVTAVPEPESYAMLLAGLGLMGTIALRRNKNRKG